MARLRASHPENCICSHAGGHPVARSPLVASRSRPRQPGTGRRQHTCGHAHPLVSGCALQSAGQHRLATWPGGTARLIGLAHTSPGQPNTPPAPSGPALLTWLRPGRCHARTALLPCAPCVDHSCTLLCSSFKPPGPGRVGYNLLFCARVRCSNNAGPQATQIRGSRREARCQAGRKRGGGLHHAPQCIPPPALKRRALCPRAPLCGDHPRRTSSVDMACAQCAHLGGQDWAGRTCRQAIVAVDVPCSAYVRAREVWSLRCPQEPGPI